MLGCAGYSWMNYRAAFNMRERARMSHLSAIEAGKVADKYHDAGKRMYQKALDSYGEGQQYWAAATEALLDAKRREAKAEAMLEEVRHKEVDFEWKEAV